MESRKRSIAKAASYRVVGSLATALLVFLFTGDYAVAMGVSVLDVFVKMAVYYAHERLWNHVPREMF